MAQLLQIPFRSSNFGALVSSGTETEGDAPPAGQVLVVTCIDVTITNGDLDIWRVLFSTGSGGYFYANQQQITVANTPLYWSWRGYLPVYEFDGSGVIVNWQNEGGSTSFGSIQTAGYLVPLASAT